MRGEEKRREEKRREEKRREEKKEEAWCNRLRRNVLKQESKNVRLQEKKKKK